MIVGVPAFAVLYYLVKLWLNSRAAKRHMPLSSEAYIDAVRADETSGELQYTGEDPS